MLNIHERGGVYCKDAVFPGINLQQIKELAPNIICEDEAIDDQGWFKLDH